MIPVTELRFSIPYFILIEEIAWSKVFILSIIGNITIGILILYIIAPVMMTLKKNQYFMSKVYLIQEVINMPQNILQQF